MDVDVDSVAGDGNDSGAEAIDETDVDALDFQTRSKAAGSWMFDFSSLASILVRNSTSVSRNSRGSSTTCKATIVSASMTILKVVATEAEVLRALELVRGVSGLGKGENILDPGTVRLAFLVPEFLRMLTGCLVDMEGEWSDPLSRRGARFFLIPSEGTASCSPLSCGRDGSGAETVMMGTTPCGTFVSVADRLLVIAVPLPFLIRDPEVVLLRVCGGCVRTWTGLSLSFWTC